MKIELEERFVNFAVTVIEITNVLKPSIVSTHLYKQLIRSATAIPLNYAESRTAESKKDFVHKLCIALKELRETRVNIEILLKSNQFNDDKIVNTVLAENNELISILTKSIATTRNKYGLITD